MSKSKKPYTKPEIKVIELDIECSMLACSGEIPIEDEVSDRPQLAPPHHENPDVWNL